MFYLLLCFFLISFEIYGMCVDVGCYVTLLFLGFDLFLGPCMLLLGVGYVFGCFF